MNGLYIEHNSQELFYRNPFGAVPCKQKVLLRIKAAAPFTIRSVILRLWMDGREERRKMALAEGQETADVYQAEIIVPKDPGLLWYYFIIEGSDQTFYYGNNEENLGGVGRITSYPLDSYQITIYKEGFETPIWFKDGVMYQIFVDRFYNGNKEKRIVRKEGCRIHENWYENPDYAPDPAAGEFLANDFFGGNLLGILEKLPYLKELGVTVLYLNPIFEAYSNHKYDTGNYKKIDPMFGDQSTFELLCTKAKEQGIAIILDGVFSHTGSDSVYFNREGRYESIGAYQSLESPYYLWYHFIHYPDEYDCWWDVKTLPNVNEMEASYQNFIIHREDSVARHWLKAGARGWRLDVVDELPDEFLKNFRSAVKETDGEAVIIGEVWEDASNKISYGKMKEYLLGEEIDSAMNYPFRTAVINFMLGYWDAGQLHRQLMGLLENYPLHCFYAMMNLVGSHDVPRIKTLLGEAPAEHSISRKVQASYRLPEDLQELAKKRLKLVSLFQMTFPGVPCIYYGDEIGMEGYRDPLNRHTYPWGQEDRELLEWYKNIIQWRHQIDALRTGVFVPVFHDKDIYGFVRFIQNGKDVFGQNRQDSFALVLLNRSRETGGVVDIDLSKWNIHSLQDIMNGRRLLGEKGRWSITLKPLEGRIWIQ